MREYEPRVALSGGPDGLSVIRRIVETSPQFLNRHAHLFLEIGFDQSEKVASLFDHAIWEAPRFYPDLQGIPRLVGTRLR